MAHRIDWDNIHLHIHDTDVRYKRRLLRKQLFIECSSTLSIVSPATGSLKKLKYSKDQIFKGNNELVVACPDVGSNIEPIRVEFGGERIDVVPELEMFKEGLREGGKSLVCNVEDNVCDDVSLKNLENGQDGKFLCDDVDPDVEIFMEGLREGGKSLVCEVEDNAFDEVGLKKLEGVQDQKFLCNDVDPDLGVFEEGLREGGKSLFCNVEDNVSDDSSLKKLENVQDGNFLCDDVDHDVEIFKEGLREGGKSLVSEVEDNASDDVGLKKLEDVQDQNFLCNDVDPDLGVFEESLREGGKSLVCNAEDNVSDDFSLKKLKNVQDGNFLCDDVDHDVEIFKEGLREGGKSLVCEVEDNASDDVGLKKLEDVQDQNFLCNDVDPDLRVFKEGLREGEKSLISKVDDDAPDTVGLKKLEDVQDRKFICNNADRDLEMFEDAFTGGGKALVCKVDDDASDDVALKKLENVQDQKFLCNDLYPELEMFNEGLREGNKSLVHGVDDSAFDDVCLKKLEIVQDQKILCNDLFPELEMFKEGLREGGRPLVCEVKDTASDVVSLKKLENVQDQKFLCNNVDPDLEIFKEGLREGGKSLVCKAEDYVSDDSRLKKLENVQHQKYLCNDVRPHLEMVEEGLREGGKSLVCEVDDNASDNVSLEELEYVQERKFLCNDEFWVECSNVVSNPEPIGVICGTREDAIDPDFEMFKEDLKEERHLFASSVVGVKKLGNVQEQNLRNDELRANYGDTDVKFGAKRMTVDPDYKRFLEGLKVDGHSFALKIKINDGSLLYLRYEKDVFHTEYQRKLKPDNVKIDLEKQKGDTANYPRNNARKEKRDKVVPRREGFSGNSNKSPVTKRSSVVKRRDNMEIINIGKPIEMEEVIISKDNRPSKTIRNKRQRPLNLDDGHKIEHLRKSKKKYEKVDRRLCLTRIDHARDLMDIAGKSKRHYRRTSPRSERRDLMILQGEDIENSRFSSGIGNMDVMVKEEKFDNRKNAVVKKRRQMIEGRDSVNDNNMRPRYKCDKKFRKYAEVKEVKSISLNYDEEDNEHSSDIEILDTDNQQNLRKFEVMKVFNASVIEDYPLSMERPSDYENSEFREELMDILRRPFDLEEYRSLMQKAKYRHLMGGPEYSDGLKGKEVSNTYGKSPLDYHPDVQRRLRQCRKISRRLNILRGFIYWYGRACQNGAFKPWLDKSCAAVTPNPL